MGSFALPDGESSNSAVSESGSQSPIPPPYSPITPEISISTLPLSSIASIPPIPLPSIEKPPPPVSISESTNSDAIALRSALSILQLQRQRAVKDLQTLERQKHLATANPEAFSLALGEGRIKSAKDEAILTDFDPLAENDLEEAPTENDYATTFGTIPSAQNIVRCPPLNWDKYHIVGEALDKIHEEQRLRPSPGAPRQGE